MRTPQQKYENDMEYRKLVDALENLIHHAKLTPSEIREAATLAAIHYEIRKPACNFLVDEDMLRYAAGLRSQVVPNDEINNKKP